jgi:AraC-like DNA-binding protein
MEKDSVYFCVDMNFLSTTQNSRTMSIIRFLFVYACTAPFWSTVHASDTMLIQVFNFEEPIDCIANDKSGRIYITFPSGVHTLNTETGKTTLIDPSHSGGIFFLEDLFYAIPPLTDSMLLVLNDIKDKSMIWLSQLPASDMQSLITVGRDSHNFHYVATSYHVYKFKVSDSFRKALAIHSVRGITEWHDTLFFNTYSGLYQEQRLIDPLIQGGDLSVKSTGDLIASSGRYLYNVVNGHSELIAPKPAFFKWATDRSANIISLHENSDKSWLIGTDRGLVIAQADTMHFELPSIVIEQILSVPDGVLLSTSKGVIHRAPNGQHTPLKIPERHYNQTLIHGSMLYLATDEGLYLFDSESGTCTPVDFAQSQSGPIQVLNMVKDNFGFLWCGTDDGLYQIDLSNHHAMKYLHTIEFNKRSRFVKGHQIYMGSTKGVYSWDASGFSSALFTSRSPAFSGIRPAVNTDPLRNNLLIILLIPTLLAASAFLLWHRLSKRRTLIPSPTGTSAPDAHLPMEERVRKYIDHHISTVTVETLAEHLGIGTRELYREIKSHFRKTPGQLIREYRKELVLKIHEEYPDESISDLAARVGYSERHIQNILGEKS